MCKAAASLVASPVTYGAITHLYAPQFRGNQQPKICKLKPNNKPLELIDDTRILT